MVGKKPLVPYRHCRFLRGQFLDIAHLQIVIYRTLMPHREGRVLCKSLFQGTKMVLGNGAVIRYFGCGVFPKESSFVTIAKFLRCRFQNLVCNFVFFRPGAFPVVLAPKGLSFPPLLPLSVEVLVWSGYVNL